MSSPSPRQPVVGADSSVARVPVDNHPLAPGAMTDTSGSQQIPPQGLASPRPAVPTNYGPSSPSASANSPPKTLDELADEFLSSKNPPICLKPKPLPRGQVGIVRLRTLVERRAWGDVLKLATSLLYGDNKSSGSPKKKAPPPPKHKDYCRVYQSLMFAREGTTLENVDEIPLETKEETVEIMVLRCNALLKLRRYTDLSKEVGQWKFLKQNDVKAPSIEWLPWGIHILAGQSLEYSGEARQATDVLCHLREDIPSTESPWIAGLDNALANIYIRRGEWRLAIGALDRLIDLVPQVVQAEVLSILGAENEILAKFWTEAYISEILSRQGRIFLQIGGLAEAKQLFGAAKTMWTQNQSSESSIPLSGELSTRNTTLRVVMEASLEINDGLVHFSDNNYENAMLSFSGALDVLKIGNTGFHSPYKMEEWVGPTVAGLQAPSLLYNEASNNISLCNLYMCNMKEAVLQLEELVREDPAAFLTERVAFNLCTLYELGSDSAVATRRKHVLQLIAKRFFLHDVGPESFRVT